MRVGILGLGLIGGSLARALAAAPDAAAWTVVAWSPTGDGPARALGDGTVAAAARSMEEAVDRADIVVLAAPPPACLDLLDWLAGPGAPSLDRAAVVTDVASTKGAIVDRARLHGLRFVGGHPMAGRETSGYPHADAALFRDRPWVVVPADPDDQAAIVAVRTLAVASGALPVTMDADAHDAAVAAVSHLPLVLAAALVEAVAGGANAAAPDWPEARRLSATGWRDMTRLARGDVAMGAGIAATNAAALGARIRDVRAVLDGWLADLDADDPERTERVMRRLRSARSRLEEEG